MVSVKFYVIAPKTEAAGTVMQLILHYWSNYSTSTEKAGNL